jgi:hypothetical protein
VAFYTCRDAYKFNDPWGWVVGSNYVRITQERTGKLKIAWELNNSRLATLTPIDGSITFYPPGHSAAPHGAIYVTGDGYPSVEFYAYRSGRAAVEFQRREGVPGELIAFWGDWSSWYAWKRP